MASLDGMIDPEAKPSDPREILPRAWYTAMVVESDVADTSSGKGKVAKFTWEIVEGPHQGRRVFQNVNVINENPKAQEIGQRELAAIREGCGKTMVRDTSELHNIPCQIYVKIRPADGQFPEKNEIAGVRKVGAPAGSPVPTQQQQQGAAPAATTTFRGASPPAAQQQPVGAGAGGATKKPWQR